MPNNELTALPPSHISEPKCSICSDPDRFAIEAKLIEPGVLFKDVAEMFGIHAKALARHQQRHMGMLVETARLTKEIESIGTLYSRIKDNAVDLRTKADQIFKTHPGLFFQYIAEARKHEEILLKLSQAPGFTSATPASSTHINAPDARIVVAAPEE